MTAIDLLAKLPPNENIVIVIYPEHGCVYTCQWQGMSAENVARTLYAMADRVVNEKIPPYDLTKKHRGL
jgi:hypothetical protein